MDFQNTFLEQFFRIVYPKYVLGFCFLESFFWMVLFVFLIYLSKMKFWFFSSIPKFHFRKSKQPISGFGFWNVFLNFRFPFPEYTETWKGNSEISEIDRGQEAKAKISWPKPNHTIFSPTCLSHSLLTSRLMSYPVYKIITILKK